MFAYHYKIFHWYITEKEKKDDMKIRVCGLPACLSLLLGSVFMWHYCGKSEDHFSRLRSRYGRSGPPVDFFGFTRKGRHSLVEGDPVT